MMGDASRAHTALSQSLALSRQAEQRVLALEALRQLAELEEASGRTAMALRRLHAHMALRDSLFNQRTAQRIAALETRAVTEREHRELDRLRERESLQASVIARQRAIGLLGLLLLLLTTAFLVIVGHYYRTAKLQSAEVSRANAELEAANASLRGALADVRTLSGLIPICSSCKKVRDDRGYWNSVENYISSHSAARFSHGICHTCAVELYGEDIAGGVPASKGETPPAAVDS
jgi:hypothetical protein